jgi:hypothetical protein
MALTTWRTMHEKPTLIEYVVATLMGILIAVVGYYWCSGFGYICRYEPRLAAGRSGDRVTPEDFQEAMQRYVERYGMAKLPIDDEEMMPLLIAMKEVGEQYGTGVYVLYCTPSEQVEKVWLGLKGPTLEISRMVCKVTDLIRDRVPAGKCELTLTLKQGVAVAHNAHLTVSAAAMGAKQ